MVTRMDHAGFVVKDLDKAVAFYRDVVGLKEVSTVERDGAPISQILGYENTHLKRTIMSVGGEGVGLELIQYLSPPIAERPTEERNTEGASHVAFGVDDIEATYLHLVERGARKLNPPAQLVPGRKACYLQDPDGNWVELVEAR